MYNLFGRKGLKLFLKVLLSGLFVILVSACGGGGGGGGSDDPGNPPGEIIGTGFSGKTAIGEAIANADIRIKSLSGTSINTTSNGFGDFSSAELVESDANTPRGPYLLRVDQGNGKYLYSIAHRENAETIDSNSVSININIHPYTDLIIRNWFAQQSRDIDSEFDTTLPISALPSVDDINAISDVFLSILSNVLAANNAPTNLNLLSTPFVIDGTGFDGFLDNSQVVINNSVINVIVNQPIDDNPIQNTIITNIDLSTDFTDGNDTAPTIPQNVRVLSTDVNDEALLVWDPSTDDRGVSYYNIYRDGSLIGTSPFPVFIDMGLSLGVAYEYTIEAIDNIEQSSGLTSVVTITLDTPDTTAPPSATDLVSTEANGVINVRWTQSAIDDVASFRVLRGPSGNVINEVATITASAFNDFNVIAGTTYCYRVVTIDAANNESLPSAETCSTVSGVTLDSGVAFSSENYSVEESAGSVEITVIREGDLSQAISVDYSALAGTATAGTDFIETSGTLNWDATDSSVRTFTIQISENSEAESDETVTLTLSNPSSTLVNGNDTALLTIIDAAPLTCIDLSPTDITSNTTLSEPCYNVNANVSVSNAATLTIDPGVRLQFAQGINFEIETDGILSALGAAQDPIVFTGMLPAPGYWDGIEVGSIANSQIDYTVVEYGGDTTSFNESNVGISLNGRLSITNSTIRHSASYGVSFSGDNGVLTNFTNNVVTLNENAPMSILANEVGKLTTSNSFAGNNTLIGGDRDYIEIQSATFDRGVTTDQTWNLLDVDYLMFPSSPTRVTAELTLAPGVTLIFRADAQLDIRDTGTLRAIGTASLPITFTGLQETPGYWNGIQFTFSNTNNVMDHTVVEYGGAGGNTTANVGVFGSGGRLSISNSTLRHSQAYGFEFDDNINLVMSNIVSTQNNQPGAMAFNDLDQLDGGSTYSGNTDDRLVLVDDGLVGDFADSTMKNISIPYFIDDSAQTPIQAALTIEPGTEIEFNSGGGFNINTAGTLIAQGTPEEPIIFTGAQKTKGYWNGFQFTFSNNPNVIDYAVVEYAGAASGNTQALVGFFGSAGLPTQGTVTNTTLRGSLTNGIELSEGTTGEFITGNIFEDIDGADILDPR